MDTYNGFEPGESRTVKVKPISKHGHDIATSTTTRRGSAFAFTYRLTCQCGKSFGSRQSKDRTWYAYNAHLKKEGLL